jgi:hypothetical protein
MWCDYYCWFLLYSGVVMEEENIEVESEKEEKIDPTE